MRVLSSQNQPVTFVAQRLERCGQIRCAFHAGTNLRPTRGQEECEQRRIDRKSDKQPASQERKKLAFEEPANQEGFPGPCGSDRR